LLAPPPLRPRDFSSASHTPQLIEKRARKICHSLWEFLILEFSNDAEDFSNYFFVKIKRFVKNIQLINLLLASPFYLKGIFWQNKFTACADHYY
jgi:hypothetical protein